MKKIWLTVLLSFLLVLSGGTSVFAEDYIDGGVDKDLSAPLLTNTVTYINTYDGTVGTPMYFRLIPAMTDTYTIETTGWVDTEGELYDALGAPLEVDDDDAVGSNFQINRELTGGETYYLRVTYIVGNAGDQTTLCITGDAGGNLSDPDTTAPADYSAAIDQSVINNANKEALSFSFTDAEVGAAYNYTVSSSGGGNVTGSGTIISNDQQITGIDVSGLADGTLTLSVTLTDQDGNTGAASTDTVTKETANAAPTATVQPITGTLQAGATLTGHYTYSDVNGDPQGTSTFKWYRSVNSAGLSKTIIAGATSITYILQSADEGKYISFEVTPVAATGTTPGTAVESALIGPVAAAAYGSLSFSSAAYSVAENGGSVIITVNRIGGSDGAVTVDYNTSNNTAAVGSDYIAAAATLSFGDGETSKTFTVSILDDNEYEGDETVNLTLSNPTGGALLGEPSSALLTITDNEAATSATAAQLAAALGSNATASGNTVTLTGNVADVAATIQIAPSENITLDLAGYSISGKNGTDFDNGITSLEIIGGTSTLTITGSGMILGGSVDLFDAADAVSISGGTVVIENGSIIGGVTNHGSGYHSCGDGIEISSGSLTIKDGAIKGGVDPGRGNYAGHGLNLRGGTVTIYGGSFYSGADLWNDSKAINASSGTVANIIAAGKIMKSYTDEGFTTGEAIIANDTLLSSLTTKYIRVQAPVVNAESPVITNDLSTAQVEYSQNVAAIALDATATVTDGGTISYAWYSNTTNSTVGATALGVTTATYTPSTATAGTTYYYCVVTNTNNAATGTKTAQTTSAIANIKVNAAGGGSGSGGGGSSHSSSTVSDTPVITVSEVKGEIFSNAEDIKVEADVTSAFGESVTVKLTDDADSQKEIFSLAGANDKVYPFDISLYSKKNGDKVQPKDGYSVKITLPVPKELLDDREKIKVVYGKDGSLETLKSELTEKDGKWYITFEAVHFSPYALIVSAEEPAQPETAPWAIPFSDVKASDWYYSAVQYAAQNGLMKGTGTNTFSPELATNRGMIATILYNLDGSEETAPSTFNDVKPGAYYANAVAWAQKKGIIAGYGNGMFGPDDSITREQLATMIWNYAGSPAATDSQGLASFMDAVEISAYAQNALAWASQTGITNGKGGSRLDPQGPATRAETAQIMKNFLQESGLDK